MITTPCVLLQFIINSIIITIAITTIIITIIITITIVTIITITIRLDRVLPPGPFCSQEKASFMHSHHSLLFGRCQFVVAVVIQVHTPQP